MFKFTKDHDYKFMLIIYIQT